MIVIIIEREVDFLMTEDEKEQIIKVVTETETGIGIGIEIEIGSTTKEVMTKEMISKAEITKIGKILII